MRTLFGMALLLLSLLIVGIACGGAEATPTPTPTPAPERKAIKLSIVLSQPLPSDVFKIEKDYLTRYLGEVSGGLMSSEVIQISEAGLTGSELVRILKEGGYDVGGIVASYVGGDVPLTEGIELVGIYQDWDAAQRGFRSFVPALSKRLEEKFNMKLLSAYSNAPNVIWCNADVKAGIPALKGKKVRTFGTPLADFISAVGGTPVSITYAEVYGALERGVVDCAVTQVPGANKARWPEVTTHLFTLPLVNPGAMNAVNLDSWNKLPSWAKEYLQKAHSEMEAAAWKDQGTATEDAVRCTTGQSPCEKHNKYNHVLVVPSAEDRAKVAELSKTVIIPKWLARCGAECKTVWNETLGATLNLQVP